MHLHRLLMGGLALLALGVGPAAAAVPPDPPVADESVAAIGTAYPILTVRGVAPYAPNMLVVLFVDENNNGTRDPLEPYSETPVTPDGRFEVTMQFFLGESYLVHTALDGERSSSMGIPPPGGDSQDPPPSQTPEEPASAPAPPPPTVGASFCAPGQVPQYVFGFATLRELIGAPMGAPLTCEFPDANGTGDVHQKTTMGLAFWRKNTNTPTFTNGWDHWAITDAGLVYWTGASIDPPADAEVVGS